MQISVMVPVFEALGYLYLLYLFQIIIKQKMIEI